jgi:hypothetical protein
MPFLGIRRSSTWAVLAVRASPSPCWRRGRPGAGRPDGARHATINVNTIAGGRSVTRCSRPASPIIAGDLRPAIPARVGFDATEAEIVHLLDG